MLNHRSFMDKMLVSILIFLVLVAPVTSISLAEDSNDNIAPSSTEAASLSKDKTNIGGYPSSSRSDYGWVYGKITDETGDTIKGACIIVSRPAPSSADVSNSRYVTYSNETGDYRVVVLPGTYLMEAYKEGYSTPPSLTVSVLQSKGTQVNIVMHKPSATDPGYGWVKGTVYGISGVNTPVASNQVSTSVKYPLKGARVSVYSTNTATEENIKTTFTDGNGHYEIQLKPGIYLVMVTMGSVSQSQTVTIENNLIVVVDFILRVGITRQQIETSIQSGTVGGEITVEKTEDQTFNHEVTVYNAVDIQLLSASDSTICVQVSGNNEISGKTIAVNLPLTMVQEDQRFVVKFDDDEISQATTLDEILDTTIDASQAKFFMISNENGAQVFIRIPQYSTHTITITSVIEAIGGTMAVIVYIVIAIVAAIVFVGTGEIKRRM